MNQLLGVSRPLTHRQFLVWRAWQELEWERPSRSDQYLMQIAVEIQRVLSSHPERIKLQDKRLKFAKPKRATTEVDTELTWQKWVSAVGPDVTVIEVDAATYDPYRPFDVEKYLGS